MPAYKVKYPSPVRRLNVVWRKGRWSVEGEVRIPSMTLLASDDLPESDRGVSGFWWEAVDRQGQVIYRHVVPDPFSGRMEVFDKDARIRRARHSMHEEVTFDILIPDLPEIAELHFFSSSKPGEEHTMMGGEQPMKKAAERIATLDIRKGQGGDHGRK